MLNCIPVFFQQVCLSIESGVWTIWIVTGCFESICHDLFCCVRSTAKLLNTWATWRIHFFVFLEVPGVWTVFTCEVAWLMGGCIRINEDPCHGSSFTWNLSPKYNQKRAFHLQYVFPFLEMDCLLAFCLCFDVSQAEFDLPKKDHLCLQLKKIFPADGFHLGRGV